LGAARVRGLTYFLPSLAIAEAQVLRPETGVLLADLAAHPVGDTDNTATRDEVHRLVDVLPEDLVATIGEVLRAAFKAEPTDDQAHRLTERLRAQPDSTRLAAEPVRTFASAGTLSAEPDLAERVEEILGTEPGTAA
jgi:hypothetical protein